MSSTDKITREQAILMTFASSLGNIVFTFTWVTYITGKPFWIAVFIGVLLNIPFALWIFSLGRYCKDATLFDILEKGFGRIICTIFLVIYLIVNILIQVSMLNMFTGTIKVFFLPRTPSWAILLFLVSICTLFASSGIKTFARLIEFLAISCVIVYFAGFSLSFIKEFKFEFLTPVLDTSLSKFAQGVLITTGSNAECLFFLMIMLKSVPDPAKHLSWAVKGLVPWAVILSAAIFIMAGSITPEILGHVGQAGVAVSRTIHIGEFIRGIEVFIITTYQFLTIGRTLLVLYSCCEPVNKLFHIKKPAISLVIIGFVILSVSIWINSFNTGYFLAVFLGTYIILPVVVLLLLVSTISGVVVKKREGSISK